MVKRDFQHVIPASDIGNALADLQNTLFNEPIPDAMKECEEQVRKGVSANFTRGGNAETQWPPRKHHGHPTKDKGRSGYAGHPLLIDMGDLYEAATADGGAGHVKEIEGRRMASGVNLDTIPYAAVHNFGGGNNIPQREYMLIDEKFVDACEDIVTEALVDLIGAE